MAVSLATEFGWANQTVDQILPKVGDFFSHAFKLWQAMQRQGQLWMIRDQMRLDHLEAEVMAEPGANDSRAFHQELASRTSWYIKWDASGWSTSTSDYLDAAQVTLTAEELEQLESILCSDTEFDGARVLRCRDAPLLHLFAQGVDIANSVICGEICATGGSAEAVGRCKELASAWKQAYFDTRMKIEKSRTMPHWDFHYVANIFLTDDPLQFANMICDGELLAPTTPPPSSKTDNY